jgi:AcrR family transcriptional regulator
VHFSYTINEVKKWTVKAMKNPSKKTAYLEKHLEAIEANGLQSIDLEDLIKLLEISRGSFYNYFQTKHDYLIDLVTYIKEKSYEKINPLLAENVPVDDVDVFINQLVLKFSIEETYEVEKMQHFLTIQQHREPALAEKLEELKALDLKWITQRFQEIFHYETIYCQEAAILFLNMVYELISINNMSQIKSPVRHLIRETVHYAQLICSYNAENQQTLFFENQQALEMQLKWDQMQRILTASLPTVSAENKDLIDAILEELKRQNVRGNIVKALISAINNKDELLKKQLYPLF